MSALERIDYDTQLVADSSYCPAHFRDKNGRPRMADLRYAVAWLGRHDLDPLVNIDQVFVTGGKVHLMAEIQRVMARRAGWDIEPVDFDKKYATVRGRKLPDGEWKSETVTMEQAHQAGWDKRSPHNPEQPSNYELMPERMLLARACTFWISQHAPDALRIIDDAQFYDPRVEDARAAIEAPVHTVRRDEPVVEPDVIGELHRRLDLLDNDDRAQVRAAWKGLAGPNLDGPAFTLRDAALLHRLIADYELAAAGIAPPVATPVGSGPRQPGPATASPGVESASGEATTYSDYDQRPFDE